MTETVVNPFEAINEALTAFVKLIKEVTESLGEIWEKIREILFPEKDAPFPAEGIKRFKAVKVIGIQTKLNLENRFLNHRSYFRKI